MIAIVSNRGHPFAHPSLWWVEHWTCKRKLHGRDSVIFFPSPASPRDLRTVSNTECSSQNHIWSCRSTFPIARELRAFHPFLWFLFWASPVMHRTLSTHFYVLFLCWDNRQSRHTSESRTSKWIFFKHNWQFISWLSTVRTNSLFPNFWNQPDREFGLICLDQVFNELRKHKSRLRSTIMGQWNRGKTMTSSLFAVVLAMNLWTIHISSHDSCHHQTACPFARLKYSLACAHSSLHANEQANIPVNRRAGYDKVCVITTSESDERFRLAPRQNGDARSLQAWQEWEKWDLWTFIRISPSHFPNAFCVEHFTPWSVLEDNRV